jgi:hypothetical protein
MTEFPCHYVSMTNLVVPASVRQALYVWSDVERDLS